MRLARGLQDIMRAAVENLMYVHDASSALRLAIRAHTMVCLAARLLLTFTSPILVVIQIPLFTSDSWITAVLKK